MIILMMIFNFLFSILRVLGIFPIDLKRSLVFKKLELLLQLRAPGA